MGLNATVLPGLGTFRTGSRVRGSLEMLVALSGTILFCGALIQAVGERGDDMTLVAAFLPHLGKLCFGVILVVGSWLSGISYAKGLFRK